ncbi:MAG: hypothetical protein WCA32_06735 [Chromatiaceae bacterium]
MIVRLFMGVGLLALGYFVGREVGRTESVREELQRNRSAARDDADNRERQSTRPTQLDNGRPTT